jgi:hypothetical protein
MADPKPLTRNQIAAFVGDDPEAIRAIERLFRVAGELTPSDIATLSASIEANTLALGAGSWVSGLFRLTPPRLWRSRRWPVCPR